MELPTYLSRHGILWIIIQNRCQICICNLWWTLIETSATPMWSNMKVVCFQVRCLKYLVENVRIFVYVYQSCVHVYGSLLTCTYTHSTFALFLPFFSSIRCFIRYYISLLNWRLLFPTIHITLKESMCKNKVKIMPSSSIMLICSHIYFHMSDFLYQSLNQLIRTILNLMVKIRANIYLHCAAFSFSFLISSSYF